MLFAHSVYGPLMVRPMSVANTRKPARITVSSFATYSSFDTAKAVRPAPIVTHVDFDTMLLPGSASRIDDAFAPGDGSASSVSRFYAFCSLSE